MIHLANFDLQKPFLKFVLKCIKGALPTSVHPGFDDWPEYPSIQVNSGTLQIHTLEWQQNVEHIKNCNSGLWFFHVSHVSQKRINVISLRLDTRKNCNSGTYINRLSFRCHSTVCIYSVHSLWSITNLINIAENLYPIWQNVFWYLWHFLCIFMSESYTNDRWQQRNY